MEELRAHATDWTQNIQNMDFRIPNPLEFNDPFLLQRRRWKRSERRRVRRGAQGTLGYMVRGGSENGHLGNRWQGLSGGSMVWLESRPPPPGAGPRAMVPGGGGGAGVATVPRVGVGMGVHLGARSFARSLSLPVARSDLRLDLMQPHMMMMMGPGIPGSEFDSRSGSRSGSSSCSSGLHGFQPCQQEEVEVPVWAPGSQDRHRPPEPDSATELLELLVFAEADGPGQMLSPSSSSSSSSSPPPPPPSLVLSPPPSPPSPPPLRPDCQLLDFFGENLAYIDESSDTLSDRAHQEAVGEGEEEEESSRRRPRKPKRKRSVRRHLPYQLSPLVVRKRHGSDIQPPSNPPPPPPHSPL